MLDKLRSNSFVLYSKINRITLMHRSLNSTEVLSKTYSRIRMGNSGLKMSTSVLQSRSPQKPKSKKTARPHSSKLIIKEQAVNSSLHDTLIAKNKKLSVMIKNVYSFAVCLQDIDWIINEAQGIIKDYIHTLEGKGRTPHRIQIENIHSELLKLIRRFSGLEKQDLSRIFPQKNKIVLSENRNILNTQQQPDTVCSFKCTDMDFNDNEQDTMPADFSKIKLPSVIKESASMENIDSSRYESQVQIKQFQSAIEVLRDEIQRQKHAKSVMKSNYEEQIGLLNQKIERYMVQWQSYKNYAGATIRKCKQYLQHIGNSANEENSEEIQRLLDDLFAWENTIDGNLLEDENKVAWTARKRGLLEELSDLEWRVKQNRAELERLNSFKTKAHSLYNTARSKPEVVEDSHQDIVKMLFVQASAIEHLI